jgi:hypothetical protein
VIIDDEDSARGGRDGSVTRRRRNRYLEAERRAAIAFETAHNAPPWLCTIERLIARPIPLPSAFVV